MHHSNERWVMYVWERERTHSWQKEQITAKNHLRSIIPEISPNIAFSRIQDLSWRNMPESKQHSAYVMLQSIISLYFELWLRLKGNKNEEILKTDDDTKKTQTNKNKQISKGKKMTLSLSSFVRNWSWNPQMQNY